MTVASNPDSVGVAMVSPNEGKGTVADVPTIDHPTDRPNFTRVTAGGVTYWFSYRTCVAFDVHEGNRAVVRENEWGPTTGKHLNRIDTGSKEAKARRVYGDEFAKLLGAI